MTVYFDSTQGLWYRFEAGRIVFYRDPNCTELAS